MRRFSSLLVLAAVVLLVPACQTHTKKQLRWADVSDGALMKRSLRSIHEVRSDHTGHVGYMRVFDVSEAGGPVYQWKYVYDLGHTEVGFVDQYGKAYRYHFLPDADQEAQDEPMRIDHLPADSLERNVMRMLGIDPALDSLSFPQTG